jgi:hypothetical protein
MTDAAQAAIAVASPTLSLNIAAVSQNTVTLTGHLTDIDAAGRVVTFGGVVAGFATTDSTGNFTFTASAGSLGTIWATASDLWGNTSNTASVTLSSNAPVIEDFQAVRNSDNLWTFTGKVVDQDAAGLTVSFGGILTGQATTDANGNFTFTCSVNEMDLGLTASAITTDWWGLQSNLATCTVG